MAPDPAVIVGSIGLIVAVVLLWFVPWGMAVVAGWDAAALAFLISVWVAGGAHDSLLYDKHHAHLKAQQDRRPQLRVGLGVT